MRRHARLDAQVAGLWLEEPAHLRGHAKSAPALGDLAGRKLLDAELMSLRTFAHAGEHGAFRRADLQEAHLVQELLAVAALQLVPQLVGAQRQRHVIGMLVISLADDPRAPVRAAAVVRRPKAVQ